MRWMRYLVAVGTAGLLVACGGGGGSGGTPGSGDGGTGGSGPTPTVPTMAVTLVNSSGTAVSSINVGSAFAARATLRNAAGGVISGRLVTFSVSDEAIAKLAPTTALTNDLGVAEVAVEPSSISARGAASMTATAAVDGVDVSGSLDFAVSASSLSLSTLISTPASLASGGNATLTTTASIGGAPAAAIPVNIAFAATCGRINGQEASAGGVGVTTDGSGTATVTYSAVAADGRPCSGMVTVTASSPGAAAQSATISVAAPVANTLTFVGATPAQIFIAGTGATEQSVVQFRVLSSVGSALANVPVRFSIDTNPGGVGIGASGVATPVAATSDQDGLVSVSLFSGTIPGPVKLRAELVGSSPLVFAETQNLTVASGPPSQRFMSLSVGQAALEGWGRDGSSTTLTVRLADRQGNAVEDGTVVNFTAEGGQVVRSCATARVNGISQCTVSYETQNPRPVGGRASVLAHTSGTKDYVDVNGNNIFDPGVDQLMQLGDAYRDDNENGVADVGEFYVPRGGTGPCPSVGGAFPSRGNTCDAGLATTVRQQAVILFASSQPFIVFESATPGNFSFLLSSLDNPRRIPMPAGTTVTATATPSSCTVKEVGGTPMPSARPRIGMPEELLENRVVLTLEGCQAGNSISIRVAVPSGLTTTIVKTVE